MTPRRTYRAVAGVDLLVCAAFAHPRAGRTLVRQLAGPSRNATLGPARTDELAGSPFAPLMGIVGLAWAVHRLWRPTASAALVDAVARLLVSAQLVRAVRAEALPPAFLLFVATEVLGSVLQGTAARDDEERR